MSVTLKALYPKRRLEKAVSNFTSATGNVGIAFFETRDKTIRWCVLVSDTAVTPAHFNNFDDDENVPVGTILIDQAVGATPMMWVNTTADTWVEIGEVT